LLWLIPMVVLLGGSLSLWAASAVGLSVVLTRLYFPGRWHDLIEFHAVPSWFLVARDATLLAVLAVLLRIVLRRSTAPSLEAVRAGELTCG